MRLVGGSVWITAVLVACSAEVINPRPVRSPSEEPGIDANAPWPVGRHDEGFTAHTYVVGPHHGSVKWATDTLAAIGLASPVVGADGTIYVGNLGGTLTALAPDGKVKGRTELGGAIEGAPAITPDAIYVGGDDGRLPLPAPAGTALGQSVS